MHPIAVNPGISMLGAFFEKLKIEIEMKTAAVCLNLGNNNSIVCRNKKILQLLSMDKRPQEIAKELCLSVRTTRSAIQQMKEKNGYKTVCGLLAEVFRGKIIS